MKDSKTLEELINTHMRAYEMGYNAVNPDWDIKFHLTITNQKVELKGVSKDVAYLRLTRVLTPKAKEGEEVNSEEGEEILLYNQAYKFESIKERLDPTTPWKAVLLMDVMGRLIAGGLEYSELIKRAQDVRKNLGPISNLVAPEKPEIVVTDQMPAPLTDEEKQYAEWAKKNKEEGLPKGVTKL